MVWYELKELQLASIYTTIIKVTSLRARWRLKSPVPRPFAHPFVQAQIKRKHQSYASVAFVKWPVDSPHSSASIAESVSNWWRHHVTSIGLMKILYIVSHRKRNRSIANHNKIIMHSLENMRCLEATGAVSLVLFKFAQKCSLIILHQVVKLLPGNVDNFWNTVFLLSVQLEPKALIYLVYRYT